LQKLQGNDRIHLHSRIRSRKTKYRGFYPEGVTKIGKNKSKKKKFEKTPQKKKKKTTSLGPLTVGGEEKRIFKSKGVSGESKERRKLILTAKKCGLMRRGSV